MIAHNSQLLVLAAWLLGLLLLNWALLTVALFRKYKLAAKPDRQPTSLEDLSNEAREFIASALQGFRKSGFETAANYCSAAAEFGQKLRYSNVTVFLVNRDVGDISTVHVITSRLNRSLTLTVASEFEDSTSITTSTERRYGLMPRNPKSDGAAFSWIKDAELLCAAHRRRVEQLNFPSQRQVVPAPGDELEFLQKEWDSQTRWLVKCRYFRLDSAGQWYRLTLLGAALFGAKMLPGIKQLRETWYERQSRRRWKKLGLSDLESDSATTEHIEALETAAPDDQLSLPADEPLHYSPELKEGEIARQRSDGSLRIYVGAPTLGQVIRSRLVDFLLIVLYSGFFGGLLYVRRIMHQSLFNAGYWWMYLLQVFFVWLGVRNIRRSLKDRGQKTIAVDHSGLLITPGRSGLPPQHIPRREIMFLNLVWYSGFFRDRKYKLMLRCRGKWRSKPLAASLSKPDGEQLRDEIMQAMGVLPPNA